MAGATGLLYRQAGEVENHLDWPGEYPPASTSYSFVRCLLVFFLFFTFLDQVFDGPGESLLAGFAVVFLVVVFLFF